MSTPNHGPVVGVVGHGYEVPKHFGPLPVTGTPRPYLEALRAAGARPVLLPGADAVDLLDVVDAVVLTGGGDLDPALSGAGDALDVDRDRDDAEIALVRAAAERRVPLLGVCRGQQVLAVAFGGSLTGGVEHILPAHGHVVSTAPGSVVRDLLGATATTTALHHQAVADLGSTFSVTARAEDGTVEAIEWTAGDWPVLGVQWHPELVNDTTGPAVFGWLVNAARTGRTTSRKEPSWKPSPVPA